MKRVTMLAALVGLLPAAAGWAADPAPLVLEAKIPLGAVSGRIDHFAFDPDRQLLFVAELGNDSVGVVDLEERKVAAPDHRAQRAAGRCLSCRHRRRSMSPTPATDRCACSRRPTSRRSAASRSAPMPTTSGSIRGATASSSATAKAGLP